MHTMPCLPPDIEILHRYRSGPLRHRRECWWQRIWGLHRAGGRGDASANRWMVISSIIWPCFRSTRATD